ncbi:phosphodiester glycosidase family protein [Phosphitispora sp. TUW77]|uniref:phosphodiester glycosidase family protein n=1 Tax=Phosphitispora sp. TUW77 TaxID=3152361 RepID=UPI003AB7AB84
MKARSLFKRLAAWTTFFVFVLTMLLPSGFAWGYIEVSRTSTSEPVAEGVNIERLNIQTTNGALSVYVMTVDLTNEYVKVDTIAGSQGVITSNKSTTNLAREAGAVAAINGDFFQMSEKAPIGITIQSGEMITSPAQRNDMYAFGMTNDNVPVFDIFGFNGTVTAPTGAEHQLFGINKPAYLIAEGQNSDLNRLNMYTPKWSYQSRGPISGLTGMVEMVVENDIVREIRVDQSKTPIPPGGYVLAGHGTAGQYLTANFKVGDPVQAVYQAVPDNLFSAVGGQALLVQNGKRHWFSQNITGNKARTSIGTSADGKTLYLVVVDGGNSSRGMTQEELADFMISIGAWTALNLDGGGSSTMSVRQLGEESASLVNKPVYGSERSIPTAIGILSTAPAADFAGLRITGPSYLLVGTKKTFTAKGYDEHYNPYAVEPDDISWTISPRLGTFVNNEFTATQSGKASVKAAFKNITQEYPVQILGSGDISKVEVTPAMIALGPGESVNLSVKLTTKQGQTFMLQPGEYEVQVKGDIGAISGEKFTAVNKLSSGELVVKVDSTTTTVRVSVGRVEKQFYGFEAVKKISFHGYPEGVLGSFQLTAEDSHVFRGAGAAMLEYDFTSTGNTRAAYGRFDDGLELPGQPFGIGIWVKGDGGNGHWLRARVTDAAGTEKLLDFTRVDWKGWKHITASIPAGLKMPLKLSDIYLVEIDGGSKDKGVIFLDEISLIGPPDSLEPGQEERTPISVETTVMPGVAASLEIGDGLEIVFGNPAGSALYNVTAGEILSTGTPTPGYNPVMPLYRISGEANGDDAKTLPASMKIRFKAEGTGNLTRLQVLLWDQDKSVWKRVPAIVDSISQTIIAKTDEFGIVGLMEDVRPVPQFTDISGSWAEDLIIRMSAAKIINGYPDERFLPGKGVTRAEFVTLLTKTLGWTQETSGTMFIDEIPDWAAGSIGAAVNRGIVQGYPDGTFKSNKNISRAEMAVIMDKALSLPDSSQPSNYSDWRNIQPWAIQAIRDTKVTGIMEGNQGLFRPNDTANRAEAAVVMSRILEYYILR